MKVVKDELLDNRMEESGIFLIWAGRPIMINSVLEGLRQSRFRSNQSPCANSAMVSPGSHELQILGRGCNVLSRYYMYVNLAIYS